MRKKSRFKHYLLASLIVMLLPCTVAKADGTLDDPSFVYSGKYVQITIPKTLDEDPINGYDDKLLTYLGVMVSRYQPSTKPNDKASTDNYSSKISIDSKSEWFIPVANQGTDLDNDGKPDVFQLKYDSMNVRKMLFSAFYNKKELGIADSNLMDGNTLFRLEVRHIFRLPNNTDIVGYTQEKYYQVSPTITGITADKNGGLSDTNEEVNIKVSFNQNIIAEDPTNIELQLTGGNRAKLSGTSLDELNKNGSSGVPYLVFTLKDTGLKSTELLNTEIKIANSVILNKDKPADIHAIDSEGGTDSKASMLNPNDQLIYHNEISIDNREKSKKEIEISNSSIPTNKFLRSYDDDLKIPKIKEVDGIDFPDIVDGWTNRDFQPKIELRDSYTGFSNINTGFDKPSRDGKLTSRNLLTYNPSKTFTSNKELINLGPNIVEVNKDEIDNNELSGEKKNPYPQKRCADLKVSPPLNEEGERKFYMQVSNGADNETYISKVKLDTKAPSNCKVGSFGNTFYFSAKDEGSGVGCIRYVITDNKLDFKNPGWFPNPKTIKPNEKATMPTDKHIFIKYQVYDKLGNSTDIIKYTVDGKIPEKKPEILVDGKLANMQDKNSLTVEGQTNWVNNTDRVKIRVNSEDDDTGISAVRMWIFYADYTGGDKRFSNGKSMKNLNDLKSDIVKVDRVGGALQDTPDEKVFECLGDSTDISITTEGDTTVNLPTKDKEGYYVIVTSSVDYGGNLSPISYSEIGLDTTKPDCREITATGMSEEKGKLTVTADATDNFSGLSKFGYSLYDTTTGELLSSDTVDYSKNMDISFNNHNITKDTKLKLVSSIIDRADNKAEEMTSFPSVSFAPQIELFDKDREIKVGKDGYINLRGRVRDFNQGQSLSIQMSFSSKPLTMVATGEWQDFSFMIPSKELNEGIHKGATIKAVDSDGLEAVDNYTGNIIVDKTAPMLNSKLPLENKSMSNGKIRVEMDVTDNIVGVDYNLTKVNDSVAKVITSEADITSDGLYVLNPSDNKDIRLIYIQSTFEPSTKLTITLVDEVGNAITYYSDVISMEKEKLNNTTLTLRNYNEELPYMISSKYNESVKTEYNTIVTTSKSVSIEATITSYQLKEAVVEILFNDKVIYNDKLISTNNLNETLQLPIKLTGNDKLESRIVNPSGGLVKQNVIYIAVREDLPFRYEQTSKGIEAIDNKFDTQGLSMCKFIKDSSSNHIYGNDTRDLIKRSSNEIINGGRDIKDVNEFDKTGIAKFQFMTTDGDLVDYTINTTKSNSSLEIIENNEEIGYNLSCFGSIYSNTSKMLNTIVNGMNLYYLERTPETEQYFIKDKIVDAIKNYGTLETSTVGSTLKLKKSGQYAVMCEMSLMNYKDLISVKEINYIDKNDISKLMNVENSSRYKFNNSYVYDESNGKVYNHELGENTKAKLYGEKIYVYSSKGLTVLNNNLEKELFNNQSINELTELNNEIYFVSETTFSKIQEGAVKEIKATGFDWIQEIEGNLFLAKDDTVSNAMSETGFDSSLANKVKIPGLDVCKGLALNDDELIVLSKSGKVIKIKLN